MTHTTFTDPNELIAKASDRFLSECLRDGLTYPMIITLVTGDGAVRVHRFESDHISQMLCKEASGSAFQPAAGAHCRHPRRPHRLPGAR